MPKVVLLFVNQITDEPYFCRIFASLNVADYNLYYFINTIEKE